jgi:hypothetical protein
MWPEPATDDETVGAPIRSDAELLDHLAARMLEAHDGAWPRVARARRIALGTVVTSDVIAGPGDDDLALVELELVDGGRATGVWVLPREMTSETVTLPLEGTVGHALLDELPPELAAVAPDAYGMAPIHPLLLPDDGDVAAALACRLASLPALGGGPLQILLGGLVRRADREVSQALRAFAFEGPPGADTLLARAALARLGDPVAIRALDVDALSFHVLDYFDLVTFHTDDGRLGMIRAPSREAPLPWEPHGR